MASKLPKNVRRRLPNPSIGRRPYRMANIVIAGIDESLRMYSALPGSGRVRLDLAIRLDGSTELTPRDLGSLWGALKNAYAGNQTWRPRWIVYRPKIGILTVEGHYDPDMLSVELRRPDFYSLEYWQDVIDTKSAAAQPAA